MANKAAVGALASILVVACVVGAAVTLTKKGNDKPSDGGAQVTTSTKNVEAMCQPTPYKATCEKTLSSANNVTEPKDYIKVAFDATMNDIKNAIMNTELIMKAASDPFTKDALHACEELFDLAVDDLRMSAEKLENFEFSKIKDVIDDLKTWLSAVITYEETCLDGFKKTEGDTGDKMVKLLNSTRELSINALSMLNSFGDMVTQATGLNRKLLTTDSSDATARRLLQISNAKPNATVALDGSGQYKTIKEALDAVPKKNTEPFIIFIKAGVYKEYIDIPKSMTNVVLIGEGPTKTKITGNKSVKDGPSTFHTTTVGVNGANFVAKNIGFENTAGPEKEQAVALRVSADKAIIYNCQIDGYQDTLYVHTYRQFYRDCTITGTVDFIFGNGEAVLQNCKVIVRKPAQNQSCMVTAQGRTEPIQKGAIVLQNCEIKPDTDYFSLSPPSKTYLGRPWKEYSRTIIMQSYIDKFIEPEGWAPWNITNFGRDTSYYAEYQNRGPGAALDKRITWKGFQKGFTGEAAQKFTAGVYINNDENWLQKANVPYEAGMMKV